MHLVSIQQEPSESAESEMYLDGEGRKRLANPCLQQTLCRPGQIPGKLRARLGAICPVKRLRSCAHSRGDSVYIATKVATKEMRDLATTRAACLKARTRALRSARAAAPHKVLVGVAVALVGGSTYEDMCGVNTGSGACAA